MEMFCFRNPPPYFPHVSTITSVRAHTRYTTGSCSPCAQAAATFSACALFSLAGREFLQYYLSSLRPTVQPSEAQEAERRHEKTFLTAESQI